MERVKKGEKYQLMHIIWNRIYVTDTVDMDFERDRDNFNQGNYFHTQEEAESMVRKLRAVLNGADVLEMPSEPLGLTEIKNNHLRGFVPERLSLNDLKAFALGFWEGCSWLESKIVK